MQASDSLAEKSNEKSDKPASINLEIHKGVGTFMPWSPQPLSSLTSTKGFSHMNHHYRGKPFDAWINESDELDVFEATRYFSGAIDGTGLGAGEIGSRGAVAAVEERVPGRKVQHRRSNEGSPLSQVKEKKSKQPSSPGARLVSYLNSFFNQAASRRKPRCLDPATCTTRDPPEGGHSAKEEVDKEQEVMGANFGERWRRRSGSSNNIPQLATRSNHGTKSTNFCGSSSFTTPDSNPNNSTPASYKRNDLWGSRSITEVLNTNRSHFGGMFENRVGRDRESRWALNKPSTDDAGHLRRVWFKDQEYLPLPRGRNKINNIGRRRAAEMDYDGGESDSSSDLFELKICDHADGLPVFATTDIEAIKRKSAAP